MAIQGTISAFDREVEEGQVYCERLEQYFLANNVGNAEKPLAILLSVCGPATYQLIRNLVAPEKPMDKSFSPIIKLMKEHHTTPLAATFQRFKLHSGSQNDG